MKPLRVCLFLGVSLGLSLGNTLANTRRVFKEARLKRIQAPNLVSLEGQTNTLLPDGRILLTGGEGPDGPVAYAALQDSRTGIVTPLLAQLKKPRAWHTATVLPDGSVLILGGTGADGHALGSAESFDIATQTFQALRPAKFASRAHHTATLLTDGRVLITGGISDAKDTLGSAEFWNFKTNQNAVLESGLRTARQKHTATLLPDGTVLLWGGTDKFGLPLTYGEVFDPVAQRFRIETSRSQKSAEDQMLSLEASIPSGGDTAVPIDSYIALRFSHHIAMTSANGETMHLAGPDGAIVVKAISAEDGILAFVTPNSSLSPGTAYTLSLSGLQDTKGSRLQDTFISFTTAGKHDSSGAGGLITGTASTGTSMQSSARDLPPLYAPSGVTALAGQALKLDGTPLEGVTVRVGEQSSKTDGTGRFLLKEISAGHHAMLIDGRTANNHKIVYGVYEVGVDAVAGSTTALKYKIWMTSLDMAHAASISFPTASEVVVKTPLLPGLEFHIPPHTTITDSDGKVASQISITPIPLNQPPFPLPAGVKVPIYFTIQPGAGYISVASDTGPKGARLIYPNTFNSAPGTRFDFWNYDADEKGWFVYGHGSTSSDKQSIVPDSGVVIYELTGAMVAGSGMAPSTGPGGGCGGGGAAVMASTAGSTSGSAGGCGGDPVDLSTGLFLYQKTDISLPDLIPITLTRTYRQNDGASRAFGIGTNHNYDIFLVGDTSPYTYQDLVLADGTRIHYNRISPGTSWTDAVYQNNSSPGPFYGSKIIWTGGWTLTLRDGSVYQFPEGSSASRGQQAALLSVTDRNGNSVTMARDANSNLTQITSPNGRWLRLTYDTNFRVTQVQDNIGRTVQYVYDPSGRLTQVTDVNGGIWKYGYDSSNNMTSITDARNILYLQNQYDANNRVWKQIQADQSFYLIAYTLDSSGNVQQTDITDPLGNVRRLTFAPPYIFSGTGSSVDGFTPGGYSQSEIRALGKPEQQAFTYQRQSGTNLVTSTTDPLNRVTSVTYDSFGNLTSITRLAGTPNAVTMSFTFDGKFNQVTSVTDPLNHTTTFSYDSKGNLIASADALGNTSTFTRNPVSQITSFTDPLGNTVQLSYDGSDLASVTDSLGRAMTIFTDGAGRTVSSVNPLGHATKYAYDALNQITQIVDPMSGVISLSYDPNGNLLSFTDPRNTSNPTTYTYDNLDRVATRKDPLGNQESYQYDANGNLTQFTDRRGKVAKFSYDGLNRTTFAGYGWTSGTTYESTVTHTYDAGNRLTQTVDSVSGTITRGFDALDKLGLETTSQGNVSYTYDAKGRRQTMSVAGQPVVNYSFDAADKLTQITQGSSTVQFGYDAASRRVTLMFPNGVVATYGYDNASQLSGMTYALGSTILGNLSYTYDNAGRRSGVSGSMARTGLPNAVSTTAYNVNNQLTTWGTANLFYDLNGNMTSDGTHSYSWDARNHLKQIDVGTTGNFVYDPFGRRKTKTISGTTTTVLYDGSNAVQEAIGANTATSLMGTVDEVFQRTDTSGARSFLNDALGSTTALIDSAGVVQTSYSFEPFGNTTTGGTANSNTFAYTGREMDAANPNLYYYRARYYSPTLQRFISEDPLRFRAGDSNLYLYAGNDPVNRTDPSGLFAPQWHDWISFVAALASGYKLDRAFGFGGDVALVDYKSQGTDAYSANTHAMSGRKQTCGDALDAAEQQLVDDIRLGNIAQAVHTIQDNYAAGHRGFQPWNGKVSESHLQSDMYPAQEDVLAAFVATLQFLNDLTNNEMDVKNGVPIDTSKYFGSGCAKRAM